MARVTSGPIARGPFYDLTNDRRCSGVWSTRSDTGCQQQRHLAETSVWQKFFADISQITARNVLKRRLGVGHGERGSGMNFCPYLFTSAQMGSYLAAEHCCANVVILTLVRTLTLLGY